MTKQNSLKLMGFTLVELLIVITIVGILIVGLVPRIIGTPAKARDAARLSDLSQIATGLESYMSDKTVYPRGAASGHPPVCIDPLATAGGTLAVELKSYLAGLPKDPSTENKILKTDISDLATDCTGMYVYEPLFLSTPATDPVSGFYLAANPEIEKNENTKPNGLNSIELTTGVPIACDSDITNDDCQYYYLKR